MGSLLSNCSTAFLASQHPAHNDIAPTVSIRLDSSPHLPLTVGKRNHNRKVVNTGSINADAFKLFLQDDDGLACFRRWLLQTYSHERYIDFFLKNDNTFLHSFLADDLVVEEQLLWESAAQLYATFIRSPNADATPFMSTPSVTLRTIKQHPKPYEFMKRLIQAKEPMTEMMALSCLKPFMQSSIFCGHFLLNQEQSKGNSSKQVPNVFEQLKLRVDEHAVEEEQYWLMKFQNIAEHLPVCICIVNIEIAGLPIVYVNGQFSEMTGYSQHECIGRNSDFLHGPKSEKDVMQTIRKAFKLHQRIKVQITNYKKNGKEFINLLTMKPIVDQDERLHYYVAVQFDLSSFSNTDDFIEQFVYTHPVIALLPERIY